MPHVFEVYGGLGYGYSRASNSSNHLLKGNYWMYFTQFNIGKISDEESNTEYGFGLKTGLMDYDFVSEGYYESSVDDLYWNNNYPTTFHPGKRIILEPTAFFRIGGEHIFWNVKVGSTTLIRLNNTTKYIPYSFLNMSTGMSFRF